MWSEKHAIIFIFIMNRERALKNIIGEFFKTTTLHGIKYLWSDFRIDRWSWMSVCVASTCCAGVLCAVLWERFLEVPALLELQDVPARAGFVRYMPRLLVCPPVHTLTLAVLQHMPNISRVNASTVARAISNVISGNLNSDSQLEMLDQLFVNQNIGLTDALLMYSPECDELIVKCRWQNVVVPCKALFEKEFSTEGVCCIMRPYSASKKVNLSIRQTDIFRQSKSVDLALECSNKSIYSCTFSAKYEDETNVQPLLLAPGYIYTAQMTFNSVPVDSEEFIEINCVKDKSYSKESCQVKCAEVYCGYCKDSITPNNRFEKDINQSKCTIKQQNCLRNYEERDNASCVCLPSCNKITSDINLESFNMELDLFTIDPMYSGLHSKSTVLHFQLLLHSSKIFSLNPTETWITLLSSLGGVFNMFLGVGLFSALEMLCLFLWKLPAVLLKSQLL